MMSDTSFWQAMTRLIENNGVVFDRPKESPHPRYPDTIYPLDYGYVENTTSSDGSGIDVWHGTAGSKTLTGILCTLDTLKRDVEIKLLLGCTEDDLQTIRQFHSDMLTLYIQNPEAHE